jgi:hypothetical protein
MCSIDFRLYYIKPHLVHWWDQYSKLVIEQDLDRFKNMLLRTYDLHRLLEVKLS